MLHLAVWHSCVSACCTHIHKEECLEECRLNGPNNLINTPDGTVSGNLQYCMSLLWHIVNLSSSLSLTFPLSAAFSNLLRRVEWRDAQIDE
jgi:hypothetical protein